MSIKGKQTEKNLLLAYTGESLNRNMYTYFADKAKEEGYEQIAAFFLEAAQHEHEHAKQELSILQTSDIELPAGVYPIKGIGDTIANLETAVSGERYERTIMYPDFAKKADEEGFNDIARLFRNIAAAESYHEEVFLAFLTRINDGSVFRKDLVVKWKCRACGYFREDREAPDSCPICQKGRGYFEVATDY